MDVFITFCVVWFIYDVSGFLFKLGALGWRRYWRYNRGR